MIVTLDYQCGCDGPEIGKALADRLDLAFYDKELLQQAAEESSLDIRVIETFDETPASGPLYAVASCFSAGKNNCGKEGQPIAEQVYLAEYHVIQKLANERSCLFIGRCADHVLQDRADCLHFFVYAPLKSRINHVARCQNLDYQEAKKLVQNTDQRRKAYYNSFSGKKWGHIENYHLCIDSSRQELADIVETLCSYIKSSYVAETRHAYVDGSCMASPAVV